ncbi:unnamed protein product, partial [Symbiodinium sp. KB8]
MAYWDFEESIKVHTAYSDHDLHFFIGNSSTPCTQGQDLVFWDGAVVTVAWFKDIYFYKGFVSSLFDEGTAWGSIREMLSPDPIHGTLTIFEGQRLFMAPYHQDGLGLATAALRRHRLRLCDVTTCSFSSVNLDHKGFAIDLVYFIIELPWPRPNSIHYERRDFFTFCDGRAVGVEPAVLHSHHPALHLPSIAAVLGINLPRMYRLAAVGGRCVGDEVFLGGHSSLILYAARVAPPSERGSITPPVSDGSDRESDLPAGSASGIEDPIRAAVEASDVEPQAWRQRKVLYTNQAEYIVDRSLDEEASTNDEGCDLVIGVLIFAPHYQTDFVAVHMREGDLAETIVQRFRGMPLRLPIEHLPCIASVRSVTFSAWDRYIRALLPRGIHDPIFRGPDDRGCMEIRILGGERDGDHILVQITTSPETLALMARSLWGRHTLAAQNANDRVRLMDLLVVQSITEGYLLPKAFEVCRLRVPNSANTFAVKGCKVLVEPPAGSPQGQLDAAVQRYWANRLGRGWRYMVPSDAIDIEDEGDETLDEALGDVAIWIHVAVAAPGYSVERLAIALHLPVTPEEAFEGINAARSGFVLAVPQREGQGPAYATRVQLQTLANLPPNLRLRVCVGFAEDPLDDAAVLHMFDGVTVSFLPEDVAATEEDLWIDNRAPNQRLIRVTAGQVFETQLTPAELVKGLRPAKGRLLFLATTEELILLAVEGTATNSQYADGFLQTQQDCLSFLLSIRSPMAITLHFWQYQIGMWMVFWSLRVLTRRTIMMFLSVTNHGQSLMMSMKCCSQRQDGEALFPCPDMWKKLHGSFTRAMHSVMQSVLIGGEVITVVFAASSGLRDDNRRPGSNDDDQGSSPDDDAPDAKAGRDDRGPAGQASGTSQAPASSDSAADLIGANTVSGHSSSTCALPVENLLVESSFYVWLGQICHCLYALLRLVVLLTFASILLIERNCQTVENTCPADGHQRGWSCIFFDKSRRTCDVLAGAVPDWYLEQYEAQSAFCAECWAIVVALWEQDDAGCFLHSMLRKCNLWAPATWEYVQQGPTWTYAQRRNGALNRPDFVLLPQDWQNGHVSSWTDASITAANMVIDHLATVVDVCITLSMGPGPQRTARLAIDVKALADPANRTELAQIIEDAPRPSWQVSAHSHVAQVTAYLQKSLSERFPKERKAPVHPYLSDTAWDLHQQVSRLRRRLTAVKTAIRRQTFMGVLEAWRCVAKSKADRAQYLEKLANDIQDTAPQLQLGGRKGGSVIVGSHVMRSYMRIRKAQNRPSSVLFADVSAAYYSTVRCLAARRPSEEPSGDALEETLARMDPLSVEDQLAVPSAMAQQGADPWLRALTCVINSDTWMVLRNDDVAVKTHRGTRPGSAWADLTFGVLVRRILQVRDGCRRARTGTTSSAQVSWDGQRHWGPAEDETQIVSLEDIVWADDVASCLDTVDAASTAGHVGFEDCEAWYDFMRLHSVSSWFRVE